MTADRANRPSCAALLGDVLRRPARRLLEQSSGFSLVDHERVAAPEDVLGNEPVRSQVEDDPTAQCIGLRDGADEGLERDLGLGHELRRPAAACVLAPPASGQRRAGHWLREPRR